MVERVNPGYQVIHCLRRHPSNRDLNQRASEVHGPRSAAKSYQELRLGLEHERWRIHSKESRASLLVQHCPAGQRRRCLVVGIHEVGEARLSERETPEGSHIVDESARICSRL